MDNGFGVRKSSEHRVERNTIITVSIDIMLYLFIAIVLEGKIKF